MNQSQIIFLKLISHDFTQLVLTQAIQIEKNLIKQGTPFKVEPEYVRAPDEYEFYLMAIGHSLGHLLGLCEQLIHAVLFLSAFSPTKKMKDGGITRANHLQYNIENFLIRTQSLEDRVLKLVNYVFHLGLSNRDCRYETITKNLHVKVTDVSINLRDLRKIIGKYKQERNIIIHHTSYLEKDLRKLEMFYLVKEDENDKSRVDQKHLSYATNRLTKKIVNQRTIEYAQFNEVIFEQLNILFDHLKLKYDKTSSSLSLKCGHSSQH